MDTNEQAYDRKQARRQLEAMDKSELVGRMLAVMDVVGVMGIVPAEPVLEPSERTIARNIARNMLKHYEGCRLESYQCTAGVWTIGYGHTRDVTQGMAWSQGQADDWFEEDMLEHEGSAIRYGAKAWDILSPVRRAVLICMSYQTGLWGFVKMRSALLLGSHDAAVTAEMIDSRWYQAKDTGPRARDMVRAWRDESWSGNAGNNDEGRRA